MTQSFYYRSRYIPERPHLIFRGSQRPPRLARAIASCWTGTTAWWQPTMNSSTNTQSTGAGRKHNVLHIYAPQENGRFDAVVVSYAVLCAQLARKKLWGSDKAY